MEENHPKKLLYFTVIDIEEKGFAGVAKKVLGQVEAFEELGYNVQLLCLATSQLAMLHHGEKTVYEHFSVYNFHRRIQLYHHLSDLCCQERFDIVYIRYPLCDLWFYRNLAKLRPSVGKVIIEIPTFPYDDEICHNHNLMTTFCAWQDRHFRNKLHQYVDLIVTYGNVVETTIWGIPVCVIFNSVSAKKCHPLTRKPHDTLNFIVVANLMYHHRYDKVLRGISEYIKRLDADMRLRFNIVGDGPEKDNLMNLAKELGISDYVVFHGIQTGEKLMELYQVSDLGLVLFDQNSKHKSITQADALKFSEYCSIGLPHVSSGIHRCYPEESSFFRIADTDEMKVEIFPLVEFAKTCNWEKAQKEMYEIVMNNMTWERSMKRVLDFAVIK